MINEAQAEKTIEVAIDYVLGRTNKPGHDGVIRVCPASIYESVEMALEDNKEDIFNLVSNRITISEQDFFECDFAEEFDDLMLSMCTKEAEDELMSIGAGDDLVTGDDESIIVQKNANGNLVIKSFTLVYKRLHREPVVGELLHSFTSELAKTAKEFI